LKRLDSRFRGNDREVGKKGDRFNFQGNESEVHTPSPWPSLHAWGEVIEAVLLPAYSAITAQLQSPGLGRKYLGSVISSAARNLVLRSLPSLEMTQKRRNRGASIFPIAYMAKI
jgi:hypothetical protein